MMQRKVLGCYKQNERVKKATSPGVIYTDGLKTAVDSCPVLQICAQTDHAVAQTTGPRTVSVTRWLYLQLTAGH